MCVASDPKGFDGVSWVPGGFGHEESVPKGSRRSFIAGSGGDGRVSGALDDTLVVDEAEDCVPVVSRFCC